MYLPSKARHDVSVIIPTYNRREMVSGAIASVLGQRDADFELIVVDDGSTDGTWLELERIAAGAAADSERVMRIVRTDNRGVAAARNAGVAVATAPLLAFLDSDDLWMPDKLRYQLDFMDAHREFAIAQTDEIWIRDGIRVNPGSRHRKRSGDLFIDSLRTCLISPSAVMLRTSLFHQMDGFDNDMLAAEDYDLWLRILIDQEVGLVDEPLVTRFSGHADQLSASVPALDRFRILTLLKLLARDDLVAPRRQAVCTTLAEKCGIYAKGLARRGREEAAAFIFSLAMSARDSWQWFAEESLAPAIAHMRALVGNGAAPVASLIVAPRADRPG
jgi:glycosyltransferase involved in cell wall biosynthesis